MSIQQENQKTAERVPVVCKKTGKLLARVDAVCVEQLRTVSGGLWCWCRNCHMEHHILWSDLRMHK